MKYHLLTFPLLLAALAAFAERPNVVFLLADDMGFGDLGCFGSPVIQSPNLDALAADGMKLLDCHSASPNCSPSRVAILTGRHPYRVGMYDYARFKPMHIPVEETTIAEILKQAGYATMFAGKWHCSGDFDTQPHPGDHGFDHWLGNQGNFGKDNKKFKRNGEKVGTVEGWMSEVVVNEAMDWLDRQSGDEPFFVCLWFSEPHTPVVAADEFRAMYPEEVVKPYLESLYTSGGPQVKRKKELVDPDRYFGCVTMLDHHIGRLLKYLEEKGLDENTLIVFTSDNGPEHRTDTAFGSSGELRGAKGHIHEGGIRVPSIVRWPGKIKAGSVNHATINGTDWMPTIAALAGAEVPVEKPIDGVNIWPAIQSGKSVEREIPLFWWLYHARGGFHVSLREGDFKLVARMIEQPEAPKPVGDRIMDFIKTAKLGEYEMYRVGSDPWETKNIIAQEPERFERLRKKMIQLHAEIRDEGPEYVLGGKSK
ncbi:MAG: sulfatase [Puniceicoccaceae bacterium]